MNSILKSLILLAAVFLSGCLGDPLPETTDEGPVSFFTGKTGGIKLSDWGNKNANDGNMPVNALLWRASLDVSSFIPLDDVDTFGGTIVTEWYSLNERPDERIKLTIFVIGRELRSDAITVHAYIQNRLGSEWVDAGRDEALGRKLENLVLTRARELRNASTAETVN